MCVCVRKLVCERKLLGDGFQAIAAVAMRVAGL